MHEPVRVHRFHPIILTFFRGRATRVPALSPVFARRTESPDVLVRLTILSSKRVCTSRDKGLTERFRGTAWSTLRRSVLHTMAPAEPRGKKVPSGLRRATRQLREALIYTVITRVSPDSSASTCCWRMPLAHMKMPRCLWRSPRIREPNALNP